MNCSFHAADPAATVAAADVQTAHKTYQPSRRELLKLAGLGALAPSVSGWFPQLVAQAEEQKAAGKPTKSCILLWMDGGPSQLHTFNLQKDGDYKGTQTSVPGIRISEYLPKLAASMNDLAIIRTMSTVLNEHGSGQYLMHMGYRASLAIDYPSLGSVVAQQCGRTEPGSLPNYINLGQGSVAAKFQKPGLLGVDYAPMMVNNSIANIKPAIATRNDARAELLLDLEKQTLARFRAETVAAHRSSYAKALELMRTDKTAAFDYKSEPTKVREMYGSGFGEQCLLARRLIEAGVAFVEVGLGGWDHHGGAAEPVMKKSPPLDQAFAALVADLKDRGLLDTTLIIWMGEFGRGPKPGLGGGNNHHVGAGHYAKAWSTVLAGAGLKTGQVIGKTDDQCIEATDTPVSAGDFFATIAQALGIDPHVELAAPGGRPHYFTAPESTPIAALF